MGTPYTPPEVRFWNFVNKLEEDECWEWGGGSNPVGYGKFWLKGKSVYAHRFSYALHQGIDLSELSPDAEIMHSCDNPKCVNPFHLSLGDAKANALDKVSKGRSLKGEKHNLAKLTEKDVLDILNSPLSYKKLASIFGVSKSTIAAIKLGTNWKHLTGLV